ncbi:hypothetical protein AAGG49_22430, partial [Stenotrophomonas maltophilia]|uniref:hypothetical protein n=1 Tax=Stenotrophomonas maltophilia TaxID=40324 RepID=UPI00313CE343
LVSVVFGWAFWCDLLFFLFTLLLLFVLFFLGFYGLGFLLGLNGLFDAALFVAGRYLALQLGVVSPVVLLACAHVVK